MKVLVNSTLGPSDVPIPDPPAFGANFRITVLDSVGAVIFSAFTVADGVMTLSGVAADQATKLAAGLGGGWTVTAGVSEPSVTIEHASDFQLINPTTGQDWPVYFADLTAAAAPLPYFQIQAYVAGNSDATIMPQIIKTTFSGDQMIAGALYSFEFKDLSGVDHLVEYQSNSTDGQDQIISGILDAIPNTAIQDNYFSNVQVSADPATPSLTFTLSDHTSLNAMFTLPGSPWWSVVPFPLALYEQVVRGAYADALKDWGQADKASMEEQAVGMESEAAAQKFTNPPETPLTGQTRAGSRYRV